MRLRRAEVMSLKGHSILVEVRGGPGNVLWEKKKDPSWR